MPIYFIITVLVWLLGLTLTVAYFWYRYYLFSKDADGNTVKTLGKILSKLKENDKEFGKIDSQIQEMISEAKLHVQKTSLVRFNPFDETGGDHSFSLALLNGKNTGILITGLHTRERTRLYVKPVKSGKSSYELSKEELSAIDKAIKNHE